jgi:hypothetical protein
VHSDTDLIDTFRDRSGLDKTENGKYKDSRPLSRSLLMQSAAKDGLEKTTEYEMITSKLLMLQRHKFRLSRRAAQLSFILPLAFLTLTCHAFAADILLSESFENASLSTRGWYDNTSGQVIDSTQHASVNGSTRSAKYHFASGATQPDSGASMRRKFTASAELYITYYVKYSSGYQGSGYSSHPHEFFILSDQDTDYTSPNYSYLQMKIEQSALKPRVIFRDDKVVNTSYGTPPVNLTSVTENRAVHGCNGSQDGLATDCYQSGNWYNGKHITHTSPVITANVWHKVAVYVKANTVSGSTTSADGILQYWLDDALIMNYNNLVIRTSNRPTIKFNQIGIAPYIGQGSPVDQTFWLDELTIYTTKPGQGPAPITPPADFRLL